MSISVPAVHADVGDQGAILQQSVDGQNLCTVGGRPTLELIHEIQLCFKSGMQIVSRDPMRVHTLHGSIPDGIICGADRIDLGRMRHGSELTAENQSSRRGRRHRRDDVDNLNLVGIVAKLAVAMSGVGGDSRNDPSDPVVHEVDVSREG